MKSALFIAALLLASFLPAKAQLAGTKWGGTIQIPGQNGTMNALQTVWNFSSDTLRVTYILSTMPPDVMVYSESDSVVTLHKVSGSIPCDDNATGKYSYEIKADQLFIHKVQDACEIRGKVDVSRPLERIRS